MDEEQEAFENFMDTHPKFREESRKEFKQARKKNVLLFFLLFFIGFASFYLIVFLMNVFIPYTPIETRIGLTENNFATIKNIDTVMEGEGISMKPTIQNGNSVLLRYVPQNYTFRRGEIIAFKAKNKYNATLHRIFMILGDIIITKGDFIPIPTEIIKKEDVIGIVVGVVNE